MHIFYVLHLKCTRHFQLWNLRLEWCVSMCVCNIHMRGENSKDVTDSQQQRQQKPGDQMICWHRWIQDKIVWQHQHTHKIKNTERRESEWSTDCWQFCDVMLKCVHRNRWTGKSIGETKKKCRIHRQEKWKTSAAHRCTKPQPSKEQVMQKKEKRKKQKQRRE